MRDENGHSVASLWTCACYLQCMCTHMWSFATHKNLCNVDCCVSDEQKTTTTTTHSIIKCCK